MSADTKSLHLVLTYVKDHRKKIWGWVRIILVAALLVGLFYYIPFPKVIKAFKEANGWLVLLAILMGFPSVMIYTMLLWVVVREKKIEISIWNLFKINLAIKFYSLFSPTSLVGSSIRWYRLSAGGKHADALTAITFTRVLDIFITIMMGLFWTSVTLNDDQVDFRWLILFLLVIVLAWIFVTRLSTPIANWIGRFIEARRLSGLVLRVIRFGRKYLLSLGEFSTFAIYKLGLFIFLGICYDLFNTLTYLAISRSLGIQLSFPDLGWMRSIVFLAALTPLTMVGGIGMREVSVVMLLTAQGVSSELALSFSIINYIRSLVVSMGGGLSEFIDSLRAKMVK